MKTLIFSRADVADGLTMKTCIAAVEEAFRMLGEGKAELPSTMSVHAGSGKFHIKAGTLRQAGRHYFAAKANGNFPMNSDRHDLPTIQGVVLLCDADNGRVLAIMDSIQLTALRTAAATAIAVRHLARAGDLTVTIVGCGVQARAQIDALRAVSSIARMFVFDRDAARAEIFGKEVSAQAVRELGPATLQSDVVVTCTTSKDFLLFPEHVKSGAFVAGVGVDSETKKELAPSLMAHAKVVTDMTSQCGRIGDLHHAIDAGVMRTEDVHAEISAIVAGRAAGRESEDEIIVFDSTGTGLQDVAAAAAIYEAAIKPGAGQKVMSIEL